jgi:hypothetical protein
VRQAQAIGQANGYAILLRCERSPRAGESPEVSQEVSTEGSERRGNSERRGKATTSHQLS